ncbi:MAG: hypothetical protein IKW81_07640, partial [Pseudobutyrivibrio sp.]|nr:hypothetical protein [Pseudobutyrivibrio sp.]
MRNRIFAALLAIMFITGTMLNSMVSFASDNNADFVETVEVSSSENVETKAEDNKTEETKSTSEGTTSEASKTEEVASQEENVDDPSEAENEVQTEEVTLEQTSEERLAELLAKDEIDLTDEEKAEKEKLLKEKAEKEEKERLEKERLEKEAAARNYEKNEPFSKSAIVNGYEIRMLAAAGVFPKGSYMSAMIVSDTSKIEETIADALPDSKAIVKVKAFDIKVYDNHGQVIQPNTEFGTVKVTISNIDTSTAMFNDKRDMEVFHMSKDNENAEEVSTSLTLNNVSFNASGFSTYAIVDVTKVTEENKQETIKSLVQSVTVTTNGDEVKKGDKISITYYFVPDLKLNYASTDTTLKGPYIETGNTYILSDNVDLTGFDFPENMSVKFSSGQFEG